MPEDVLLEKPTVVNDSFDGSDKAPEEKIIDTTIVQKVDEKKADEPLKVEDKKVDSFLIEDGSNFLKEKLGYDKWEDVKSEIETLKKRPESIQEQKFENEESQQIHELIRTGKKKEVLQILALQDKLENLASLEVNNDTASEIIKTGLKLKYKDLNDSEIDYKYNKLYSFPKEPKGDLEDEDFKAEYDAWKEQCEDVKMSRIIDAKTMKPEIEQAKKEIKLPEIVKEQTSQKAPTLEELEVAKKQVDSFLQNADAALKSFEGFNVTYKDKDVEVQSNYSLSDDEKTSVSSKFKVLAENEFNSNALFADRWVNEDNTFNFKQIAKDLATLEADDKRSLKFVSDTVAKAKLGFIKEKHNIDLVVDSKGELQLEDKDTQKKNEDAIWQ